MREQLHPLHGEVVSVPLKEGQVKISWSSFFTGGNRDATGSVREGSSVNLRGARPWHPKVYSEAAQASHPS